MEKIKHHERKLSIVVKAKAVNIKVIEKLNMVKELNIMKKLGIVAEAKTIYSL